ncbi:MAG: DUF898 family protein [Deltaproteobacteria bacterium]|nr:DUF898 family protein [Deltaproteobacteria bacterium]MCB9788034.1 DUF898 family protein [Deltaproteobacteria bacterium]
MSQAFFVLRIVPPDGAPEEREIHASTTVLGRKSGDIIIADAGASGQHAELVLERGRLVVRDLGSTNGILFDNKIVREPFPLGAGESFQIGRTRFEIVSLSAPPPTAPRVERPPEPEEPSEKTVMAQPVFLDEDFDSPPAQARPAQAPPAQARPAQAPPAQAPPAQKPGAFQTASFELEPRQREAIMKGAAPLAEEPMEKTAFLQADEAPGSRPVQPAEEVPEKTAFLQPESAPPPRRPEPAPVEAEKTAFLQADSVSAPPARRPEPVPMEAEKTAFMQAGDAGPDDGFGAGDEDRATWLPDSGEQVARVAIGGERGVDRQVAARVEAEPTAFVQATGWDGGGGGGGDDDWAQAAASGPPPAAAPQVALEPGIDVRMDFAATGGELFGQLIVGMVLTLVTLGIYLPWFIARLASYASSRTTITSARSQTRLGFSGEGKELFILGLKGYVLTVLTLGIYGFWFLCDLIRFFTERAAGQSSDGTRYEVRFGMTGMELLKASIVGYVLTLVTLGIYAPWFICRVRALMSERTTLYANGQEAGSFEFHGSGGGLFKTFIVGYLLTMVTFGIYAAWFQVKLKRFFLEHTLVRTRGRAFQGLFTGSGKDLFVILIVGGLLTSITFGVYFFWFFAKQQRFVIGNTAFREVQA